MKPIILICKDKDWLFFKDYFESIETYLPIEKRIPLFHCSLSKAYTYLFVLEIPKEITKEYSYFYINTEQLTKDKWNIQVKSFLDASIPVLDYDETQSHTFQSPLHFYFPTLPSPLYSFVSLPKCYDVGICAIRGSKRRYDMYQLLINRGVRVIDINQWGIERDKTIGSCKLLLNIHYDTDYQVFEHLRCDRWVMANHIVVSETSPHDEKMDLFPFIHFTSYESMVEKVVEILSHYEYYTNEMKQNEERITTCILKRKDICHQQQMALNQVL